MAENVAWNPLPLARAILAEGDPAPYALLAAWRCLYRDDCDDLTALALEAARRNREEALRA